MSGRITVAGGLDTVDAPLDEMRATAALFRALGTRVDEVIASCAGASYGMWNAALLDPTRPQAAARLEQAMDQLASIESSLRSTAGHVRRLASHLAAAAADYAAADHSQGGWFAGLTGDIAGLAHSVWRTLGPALEGWAKEPLALGKGVGVGLATGSASKALGEFITDDPQLADDCLDPLFALAAGLPTFAGLLDAMFPDGHPDVTAAGDDRAPAASTPPRDVGDLVTGVAWRDAHEQDTTTTKGGEIDVKFLHHTDGSRSVIVDVPGTRKFNLRPGRDTEVADTASNLRAVRGVPTTYEKGVLTAMHRAGVRPDDKVMLVGHSLGGMVAVETARDADRAKGARHFEVTDVVTAGSPIARTVRRLPSTVQVLALENSDDLVPQAEGETNPARRDVTTVTGSSNYHDVGDNHGLRQSYEHIAESVDTSNDPALEYFRADAEDFFDADSVRTERYVVSRAYH